MKFNIITLVGLLLLIGGVILLLGVPIPGSETVVEVGDISASVETERSVQPWIAGLVAALGLAAVVVGQKGGG